MSQASTLKKDVFGLAAASAIDYVLQFMVPMIVARSLSPAGFGGYRMAWLVGATVMAIAPLHMPQSLSYFLPRVAPEKRLSYIISTITLLLIASLFAALAVNPWLPLLPLNWLNIGQPSWYFPAFAALWVLGSLSDWVAIGDGKVQWQVRVVVLLSVSRTLLIGASAWFTHDLHYVLMAMLLFAALKLLLFILYLRIYHGRNWVFDRSVVREQFLYAWPFGLGDTFYLLRQQCEQWLIAAMFSAREFAAFSLGGVAAPLFTLMRSSVQNAVLPKLSALHATKDMAQLTALNRKATSAVAFVLIPAVCILWVYSEQVITFVYTATYREAGAVMRVYLLGFLPQIFESTVLLRVAGYGGFGLRINAFMLPFAIACSFAGIKLAGLPGGAAGSALCSLLTQLISVRKVCKGQGIAFRELYDLRALGLYLLLGAASAAISYLAAKPFADHVLAMLLAGGGVSAILFCSGTYFLNIMPAIAGEKVKQLLRKFSRNR